MFDTLQFVEPQKNKSHSEQYQRFEELARELIAVPKSEIQKREAEYQKQKKASKKRRVA